MQEKHNGFTLTELLAALLIISITAFILASGFMPHGHGGKQKQAVCASNLKQIGMAALMYAQEYDDTFPPTVRPVGGQARLWLGAYAAYQPRKDGFLTPYLAPTLRLFCAEKQRGSINGPAYLNNDLLGTARKADFAASSKTVLFMDGETPFSSIGHAYDASRPDPTVWNHYPLRLKSGEVVSDAAKRHGDGANYLLADGHFKWYKQAQNAVFFPPRKSASQTHSQLQTGNTIKTVGPDPGGDMTYNGIQYAATFHLR